MGKTQRKRERERENESGKRDRATKMEGRLYGAVRKEAREESLCLMSLRRGELLAIYASSYVATRGSARARKYFIGIFLSTCRPTDRDKIDNEIVG